jgi:hypothetical protein
MWGIESEGDGAEQEVQEGQQLVGKIAINNAPVAQEQQIKVPFPIEPNRNPLKTNPPTKIPPALKLTPSTPSNLNLTIKQPSPPKIIRTLKSIKQISRGGI